MISLKEQYIVDQFFGKLEERDGLAIAANTDYSYSDALEKLKRKYGIKNFDMYRSERNIDVDGEKLDIYEIDGKSYGINEKTDEYWNLDKRVIEKEFPVYEDEYTYDSYGEREWNGSHLVPGETETKEVKEYQINSSVTDENILEFLKAIRYLYSKERGDLLRKARKDKEEASKKGLEKAKSIIKVEILDSDYKTAEYYADDDDSGEEVDEDAKFDIKVSVGQTSLFTGTVYPSPSYDINVEETYYRGATMYNSYGDPGDPAEGAGVTTVTYTGLGDIYIEDEEGNEINLASYADKIPEGMFRNMYIDYAEKVIADTIDELVAKTGDYEKEWDY